MGDTKSDASKTLDSSTFR